MNAKVFFAILGCIFLWAGCTEEILTPDEVSSGPASTPMTKAEPIEWFDWEHVDWMPTPPGQARIPIPWNGQGSLVGSYELDVVNDYIRVSTAGGCFIPHLPLSLILNLKILILCCIIFIGEY